MPNANEIKIIIGGDPSGFTKAARDVTVSTDRMRTSMKDAASAVPQLSTAINSTTSSLSKVSPGANQATTALSNLGRVAQDAPFGFIGIQNNINPLLESFQRLKAETGSTSAAFKALGSSLIGAGGLGLAVSVITSALTFFALGSRGAKEQLEGLAKAMDEANKKAGDEIARVQVLNVVISDNTRSQTQRASASKELSGILDDLNIKMTKEEILNGNVAKATQLATAAIIERAKARAAEARIGEISGDQLQRDQKRIEITEKLTKAQQTLAAVQSLQGKTTGGGSVAGIGQNTVTAQLAVSKLQNSLEAVDDASAKARKEIEFLIGTIKTGDLTVDLNDGTEKSKKALDLLKQRIEALKQLQSLTGLTAAQQVELVQLEIQIAQRDGIKLGFTKEEIQQEIEGIIEKAFPVSTFTFDLEARPNIKLEEITPNIDVSGATGNGQIEIPAPKLVFTNLVDAAKTAREQLRDTLFNSLVQGIQEGAAVIGEAFAGIFSGENITSSLARAAEGLLGIVGGILQEVGKQIIATSALVKLLKTAIGKLFGPGGEAIGFAVGAALVATGAILKNIKFNVPKLAEGGIATGATLGIFGEKGKEAIIPLDKLPQMLGKLNFANQSNVILQPSIRFSLTEFQLGLQRVDSQRRRLG